MRRAVTLAALILASACDPGTRRPTFTPRPEAATTELELTVPAATRALAEALQADSVPLARVAPRDGYLETSWLDAVTMRPATGRPVGQSAVRLRGWVDPSRYGFSRLTVEVVYRATVDPSLPVRETEAPVPYANPARSRVRALLGKLGGTPVDQPEVVVVRAPARAAADSVSAKPGRLPIPSPVSVDSGTLLRGKRDSITSRAPAAAPTQGQRAGPPAAVIPTPTDSARRVRGDTARPAPADTTRRALPDTVRRAVAPAVRPVVPAPVQAPAVRSGAPPAARSAGGYTIQVAAARTRAEADPIVASLVAKGFAARIVSSGGWLKVWVGDYPTFAAAQVALRQVRTAQGGSPFIVIR